MKLRWHGEINVGWVRPKAVTHREETASLAPLARATTTHRRQRHPQAYRQVEGEIRKCRVAHFPYVVIYRVRSDFIEIIAVMHPRRSPGYWKQRT